MSTYIFSICKHNVYNVYIQYILYSCIPIIYKMYFLRYYMCIYKRVDLIVCNILLYYIVYTTALRFNAGSTQNIITRSLFRAISQVPIRHAGFFIFIFINSQSIIFNHYYFSFCAYIL